MSAGDHGGSAVARFSRFSRFSVQRLDGRVAVVEMLRPERLSAMDRTFFDELPALLAELDDDEDVAACVLTGSGRAFSAGGDIATFKSLTDVHARRRHLRAVYDAFHAVEVASTVVVGAVNGIAFGGGTELALACDLVVCSSAARFSFKEVTVGLMPGFGVIRGPDVIGRPWTRRLALTGEEIGAGQALAIGLVQETTTPERLIDRSLELARSIASHDPLATSAAKRFVNRDTTSGFLESIEATALLFAGEAHARAVDAFLSRSDRSRAGVAAESTEVPS